MDGNHPKNINPRPKRRKDKDNPYEIFTIGIRNRPAPLLPVLYGQQPCQAVYGDRQDLV